jgi:hypothetical protein
MSIKKINRDISQSKTSISRLQPERRSLDSPRNSLRPLIEQQSGPRTLETMAMGSQSLLQKTDTRSNPWRTRVVPESQGEGSQSILQRPDHSQSTLQHSESDTAPRSSNPFARITSDMPSRSDSSTRSLKQLASNVRGISQMPKLAERKTMNRRR